MSSDPYENKKETWKMVVELVSSRSEWKEKVFLCKLLLIIKWYEQVIIWVGWIIFRELSNPLLNMLKSLKICYLKSFGNWCFLTTDIIEYGRRNKLKFKWCEQNNLLKWRL